MGAVLTPDQLEKVKSYIEDRVESLRNRWVPSARTIRPGCEEYAFSAIPPAGMSHPINPAQTQQSCHQGQTEGSIFRILE